MTLRIIEIVELFVIYGTWLLVTERYRSIMPEPLYRVAQVMAFVPVASIVAIATNLLASAAITPGNYVLVVAFGVLAVTIGGLVLVSEVRQLRAYRQASTDIDGLAPCTTSDCVAARHRMAEIRRTGR